MELIVLEKAEVAVEIARITFGAVDGGTLPVFEPGAHLQLSFAGFTRRYSLTSSARDVGRYEICVLRAAPSRGGSAYLHDRLQVGDRLEADGPFNAFPVRISASHSVFLAGGIGITPFFSMMEALDHAGRSFELHYAARSADRFVPVPKYSRRPRFSVGANGRRGLDIPAILAPLSTEADLYVCGPRGLIAAVRTEAAARGWPNERVHFESFGAGLEPTDSPVRVRLALSGSTFDVAPGTTLLDALLAHGVWAPYECRRGECGSCVTGLLGGEPDHRDVCLTEEQRRHAICTCVSWARSAELVLEL